jgi:hypothetical protein
MLTLISNRNFELIRDAIGRVLTAEFANQVSLGLDFNVSIFSERYEPIDANEGNVINVFFSGNQIQEKQSYGVDLFDNKFIIEIYTNDSTDENDLGSKKAAERLSRIFGIIWAILRDPQYNYLDFTDKTFIQHRYIQSMDRTMPKIANEACNVITGIIEVHYLAGEFTQETEGNLETYLLTQVKIAETEKGYQYVIN